MTEWRGGAIGGGELADIRPKFNRARCRIEVLPVCVVMPVGVRAVIGSAKPTLVSTHHLALEAIRGVRGEVKEADKKKEGEPHQTVRASITSESREARGEPDVGLGQNSLRQVESKSHAVVAIL